MNLSFQLPTKYMLLSRLSGARWSYQRGLIGSKHTISFHRNPRPVPFPIPASSFGANSRFSTCTALTSDTRDGRGEKEKDKNVDVDVDGNGNDSSNRVQVRFFEQTTRQSKTRTEVKSHDVENDLEEERVRAQIRKLRQELEIVRQGPFGPQSPFMQSLPERERNIIQEIIHKYELENPGSLEAQRDDDRRLDSAIETFFDDTKRESERGQEEVFEPTPPKKQHAKQNSTIFHDSAKHDPAKNPLDIELKVSDVHQAYISQLNKSLRHIRMNPRSPQAEEAWRWYRRCRESIPSFATFVPSEAFDLLWETQVRNFDLDIAQRFAHGLLLADDVSAAGKELSQSQWLDYITLLGHDTTSLERSLALWRDREVAFDFTNLEDASMYWKLGVHLLVATGRLQEAHSIALSFLSINTKGTDPRILIPLIIALAKREETDCESSAWALYLKLKNLLKTEITMEDYDMISIGFLEGGKTAMGLAVFKDMMLTGQKSHFDSTALYAACADPADNDADTEYRVNQVSLEALTILPRKFQNKFFYASWMKKLIGMGKVNSAAAVAELMFERGIRPDTKHLNGVVAGWLRQGDAIARSKAEKLGWAMIQQRIDAWWRKVGAHSGQEKTSVQGVEDESELPPYLERRAPAATIETFSILSLHYIRRGDEHMTNYLIECLSKARLKPNSFIMNHLMYAELRKQDVAGAWSRYEEMTTAIRPDLETFTCLWDCAKIQNDRSRALSSPDFPPVRVLYSEMMNWFFNSTPRQQKLSKDEFSKDLYDQIFRCFSYALDTRGTIVALFSLRETFGFVPDDDTVRILMFQILRLFSHKGRIKPSASRTKQNLDAVSRLFEILRERRTIELAKKGLMVRDLDPEAQKNLNVDILGDLLRVFLNRQTMNVDVTEEGIRCAAEEMGLPHIDLGDPIPELL